MQSLEFYILWIRAKIQWVLGNTDEAWRLLNEAAGVKQ